MVVTKSGLLHLPSREGELMSLVSTRVTKGDHHSDDMIPTLPNMKWDVDDKCEMLIRDVN